MSEKTILRFLGIILILIGAFKLILGKAFVLPWRLLGGRNNTYFSFLLHWPGWLFRLVGAGETVAGARLIAATQVQVKEMYGIGARVYDPLLAIWNAALADVEGAVDQAITEYLAPSSRVLDLGCGTGANVARLQRLGIPFSHYVGVDLTPEMLAVARQKFGHLPNVTFLQLNLLHDPLPEEQFDFIISTWLLSHLGENAREVVQTAQRHLKPDGHIVLLMFSQPDSWLTPIVNAIGRTLLAEPVPKDIYLSFPGRIKVRRLAGGVATLIVLGKVQ